MTSTMDLADVYADSETAFWFGQEQSNARVDTDERLRRDEARAALEQRIKELEADAARYRWLRDGNNDKLTMAKRIAENHYGMEWDSLIDRAMSESALDKMRQISEELKLP